MKVLITGGAGFIGSAVANYFVQNSEVHILDAYNYAADDSRLVDSVVRHIGDITERIMLKEQFDWIIHMAAETHVDNSIIDPVLFAKTNVIGTVNMLEFARSQKDLKGFLYFNTDEVFGPAPGGVLYKEDDRFDPGNPYSAGKAGGSMFVKAYANTYKLPVIETFTMNAYGPGQHIEKFIPMTIDNVRNGRKVIIHSDPTREISGSRFYIHTQDIAEAVYFIINQGVIGKRYNIVGKYETSNLDVAKAIAELLDKPLKYEMMDFHSSRPGHDLRYALDGGKLAMLGWEPKIGIMEGIKGLL